MERADSLSITARIESLSPDAGVFLVRMRGLLRLEFDVPKPAFQ